MSHHSGTYSSLDARIVDALRVCEFQFWYPKFVKYSIKSKVIDLPLIATGEKRIEGFDCNREFINYLQSDGIILPQDYIHSQEDQSSSLLSPVTVHRETFDYITDRLQVAMADFREGELNPNSQCFFVKTNWSCPSDAKWILTGQCLKCYNVDDVFTLLKASDRVLFDLQVLALRSELQKPSTASDPETFETSAAATATATATAGASFEAPSSGSLSLVVRKWANLNPCMEFRCFVRNKALIGAATLCLLIVASYGDLILSNILPLCTV